MGKIICISFLIFIITLKCLNIRDLRRLCFILLQWLDHTSFSPLTLMNLWMGYLRAWGPVLVSV